MNLKNQRVFDCGSWRDVILKYLLPSPQNKHYAFQFLHIGCLLVNLKKWNELLSHSKYQHFNAIDVASSYGYLNLVKWLHENHPKRCTTYAMDLAASRGHLKVVQWLHANCQEGCTAKAITWAAQHGHFEVVQWLHETEKRHLAKNK